MTDGLPPQKSRSVTVVFVTLQRDPPLTRIFAPGARAPSRSTTERERLKRRAKIAVGQAGGAGADDRHVARRRKLEGQSRKLNVKRGVKKRAGVYGRPPLIELQPLDSNC